MKVLVVGGSGGIGDAIVRELRTLGHVVWFTYHSQSERAHGLAAATGATALAMDVTSSASVDEVVNGLGSLDAVVYNAAIHIPQLLVSTSDRDWQRVIDTNLSGAFFVSRAVLMDFVAQRNGRFVFVSSIAQNGMSGEAAYAASKAGLVGLACSVAKEYGKKGITSNIVVPGMIDVGMVANAALDNFWTEHAPLGRKGTAGEVAAAVAFLLSDGARFITGQSLAVSGGLDFAP